jgi:hypothetical protein
VREVVSGDFLNWFALSIVQLVSCDCSMKWFVLRHCSGKCCCLQGNKIFYILEGQGFTHNFAANEVYTSSESILAVTWPNIIMCQEL